jgi:hypothetical protein
MEKSQNDIRGISAKNRDSCEKYSNLSKLLIEGLNWPKYLHFALGDVQKKIGSKKMDRALGEN